MLGNNLTISLSCMCPSAHPEEEPRNRHLHFHDGKHEGREAVVSLFVGVESLLFEQKLHCLEVSGRRRFVQTPQASGVPVRFQVRRLGQ